MAPFRLRSSQEAILDRAPSTRTRRARLAAAALFVAAALHAFSFDFRHQPIFTDVGFYLHFARVTAAGAMPYRDYFEHKTPLATFAGAGLDRLGHAIGADTLYAVRVGYLLLAALLLALLARIAALAAGDGPAAPWLALLVGCSFPLLGFLPATGNVPKLIAMVAAAAAPLLVDRRRWLAAGACAGIAAMDWQPAGAILGVAVLTAAGTRPPRARALGLALAGMGLSAGAVLAYLAAHDALVPFVRMSILPSIARAESGSATSLAARVAWITHLVRLYGGTWQLVVAAGGVAVLAGRLVSARRSTLLPALTTCAVYHLGIILFSLGDFQALGDLLILDGTLAFLAAVAVIAMVMVLARGAGTRSTRVLEIAAVATLVLLARPSFLATGWRTSALPPIGDAGVTLAEQRAVASRFAAATRGARIVVLRHHDLLVLGGRDTSVPFAYWNAAALAYYGEGRENEPEALARLLRAADADVIVGPLGALRGTSAGDELQRQYHPVTFAEGAYRVVAWMRSQRRPEADARAGSG